MKTFRFPTLRSSRARRCPPVACVMLAATLTGFALDASAAGTAIATASNVAISTLAASAGIHIAPYQPAAKSLASASPSSSGATFGTASPAPAGSLSSSETLVNAAPIAELSEPYQLTAGVSLATQLRDWAKRANWTVSWNIQPDWIVPGAASYAGDFPAAATQVIQELSAAGVDVRADLYTGNHTLVIHPAGNE